MMNDMYPPQENQEFFKTISELLKEEIDVHEEMQNLLKAKQQAIMKNDVPKLRDFMQTEQDLIRTAKTTMKNLEDHLAELKITGSSSRKTNRLTEVIAMAPLPLRNHLSQQRKRLRVSVEELSKVNQENRYLLNYSLEMVKGMVQLFLRGDEEQIKLYNVKGHVSSSDRNHKLLNVQI